MPNKQLTATVRLNTSQAEKAIDRLSKKINSINNAVNKQTSSTRTMANQWEKVNSQVEKVASKSSKLSSIHTTISSKLNQIKTKVRDWWTNQRGITSATKSTDSVLSSIWRKLKGIAATYLGIMGGRALIDTTDTIIGAENKLNYVGAQQLGDAGYNSDGTYSPTTYKYTQDAMDKMYNSAQKVRMAYGDMMGNVSKSMVLAGNAFDGSIDNAIRFQEIMAESYAIGGANAQEMSTSMYQLIQALGAGVLAGDELRSVREGAPLAYKAIEQFAQGVYNTDESLKKLASDGRITSDLVVAAILSSGDKIDQSFAQTAQTFAQTWTQIKNVAMKAFEPVARLLRDMLNKAIDSGLIDKIESFFTYVSKGLQIVINALSNAFDWITEHWEIVKSHLVAGLTTIGTILTALLIKAIVMFVVTHYKAIMLAAGIYLIVYALYAWQAGLITTQEMATKVLLGIAILLALIGIVTGKMGFIVAAVIVGLLALILNFFAEICGGAWVALTFVGNLFQTIGNFIMGIVFVVGAFIANCFSDVVNFVVAAAKGSAAIALNFIKAIANGLIGVINVFSAVGQTIAVGAYNLIASVANAMFDLIIGALGLIQSLLDAVNPVLEFAGLGTISVSGAIDTVSGWKMEYKTPPSISDAWSNGINTFAYEDPLAAWDEGWNTLPTIPYSTAWNMGTDVFGTGLSDWDYSAAYNEGYNWGSSAMDSLNKWGSQGANWLHDKLSGLTVDNAINGIADALGVDPSEITDAFSGANNGESYDPSATNDAINNALGNLDDIAGSGGKTAKNTGSMADSMDLAEEDLSYLRDLAEKEWKKEFTTASIKVDMSNVNTINNQGDLDGWVTTLVDKLYEELGAVADGVYA